MPKKARNVPTNETPAQKFIRLANQRVNNLIKTYKQLGALGGSAYQSSPEQIKKIESALVDQHTRAIDQLNKKQVSTTDFKL